MRVKLQYALCEYDRWGQLPPARFFSAPGFYYGRKWYFVHDLEDCDGYYLHYLGQFHYLVVRLNSDGGGVATVQKLK